MEEWKTMAALGMSGGCVFGNFVCGEKAGWAGQMCDSIIAFGLPASLVCQGNYTIRFCEHIEWLRL
jgi:hypothetical protein